ncbi:immune inhibitor A domain-containing protein [Conexibacter sp. SYSU D00693]|uniref:immune inhibitor A domain-containing protein n=1 Tax=Conexibacter sp. SYSU D00693 TaxID=2812560 RepID=UPI00196B2E70|nr:immune inhibitor A domain-containing protein [Conexibacter sp. SYSU D00693]
MSNEGSTGGRIAAVATAFALLAGAGIPLAVADDDERRTAASAALPDRAGQAWLNPVAPAFRQRKDEKTPQPKALEDAWRFERSHTGGNPKAARLLAADEDKATKTGRNPAEFKQAPETQEAKLLTILVEFDEAAKDDFSGVMVPKTVFGDRTCVPGTVQSGPLHNQMPDPAKAPFPDNNTFWVPDFSPAHYDKLLYSTEGITERVRPDLRGPDGQRGIDISGSTMRNHYLEMSKGAYTVTGAATPWVKVDHSEAWYGADRCTKTDDGGWEAGEPQRQVGHPDNPKGPGQLAIDAVNALVEQDPEFPLEDYDAEDQFDRDGDEVVDEPDGYVDHVVLVHAGKDKSSGGGAQGPYAIWAHSSSVIDGDEIGDTGLRLDNYIVQPEDSGVGVFSHEYGHDLGLPDLYDTSNAADSDIEFWDLMSSGSHSGPIFQSLPTHMGIWDKWVLGWADPAVVPVGARPRDVTLGQTSRTPVGTEDGLRVELPPKQLRLTTPHSGQRAWWTGDDQEWADVRLTRTLAVPQGTDVKLRMWNDYVIEEDWDFGFVEVSTDGGQTWAEQEVFTEGGARVSTPADYEDPNGRMQDFGGKRFGLTGSSGGWRHDYVDLAPFAGQTVQVRLRYATDEAFEERGWFVDDLSLTNGAETVWSDDAEANNGWTPTVASFTSTTGEGWRLDPGVSERAHYYLAEWRNLDGFDRGLAYGYDSTYAPSDPAAGGAWRVEKVAYNAPGMLVWYRDTTYGEDNHPTAHLFDLPSTGSKGGLLLVDSHFDPLRHTGRAAEHYVDGESDLENFPVRVNASDAAFSSRTTSQAKDCFADDGQPTAVLCTTVQPRPGVAAFTDSLGWYPGLEARGSSIFFRDVDGSVVIPSRGNERYSTRVVQANGKPATELYGKTLQGGAIVLGSGNPGDEGKQLGVSITVRNAKEERQATVRVTAARAPGAGQ